VIQCNIPTVNTGPAGNGARTAAQVDKLPNVPCMFHASATTARTNKLSQEKRAVHACASLQGLRATCGPYPRPPSPYVYPCDHNTHACNARQQRVDGGNVYFLRRVYLARRRPWQQFSLLFSIFDAFTGLDLLLTERVQLLPAGMGPCLSGAYTRFFCTA
jgi:hypothetical protein